MRIALSTLIVALALAGCADYQPGRTNFGRTLNQNLPANGQPESPNARPR